MIIWHLFFTLIYCSVPLLILYAGTLTYAIGDKYEGWLKDHKPHSQLAYESVEGTMIYANGDTHVGLSANGNKTGIGW